jgi:hypothetical protein
MGYKDTIVPDDREPPDYTYKERRAELLRAALQMGHPDKISRTRMGERYDVAPSTITRDIDAIREEIHEDLSVDADSVSAIVYRKAIRAKVEEGDWMAAVDILESWNQWLYDRGIQDKAADKLEMDLDASVEKDERKALVGVNLSQFAGINPDQMVGMDLAEEMDAEEMEQLGDAADIPLTDNGHQENGESADE